MDCNDAKKLLEKYVNGIEEIVSHSVAVSDFLYELSLNINEKHPEMKIDAKKLRVAGLLHDIGKLDKELPHTLAGVKILEMEGLGEIAKIIKTHTIAKEEMESRGITGNFEPETIEEELLTYADSHVKGSEVVSFEERFSEVIDRSKDDKERNENLIKGMVRIKKIVAKIDGLLEGPQSL
jgi:putative nucleotidyltransferase with HDIG domain